MTKYLYLCSVSLCLASPALGQDVTGEEGQLAIENLDEIARELPPEIVQILERSRFQSATQMEITVLADGLNRDTSYTGQPITILGADEISTVQGADITRVLQRAPGVTITRNGGVGGFTGIRVRGAEAEQLLTVIDGVRVADQASPGGGFDFGNLLPANISKIELLRGSNSTIWGSQALGGVLAITSRQSEGVFETTEYGARDTFYAARSLGKRFGRTLISISGSYYDTDGFSSAAVGTENDGFRQWQLGGHFASDVTDSLSIVGGARYNDGTLDIDGFSNSAPFGLIDTNDFQKTEELSGHLGVEYYLNYDLRISASYSASGIDRENFSPALGEAPSFASKGRSERAEVRAQYHIVDGLSLSFGGEKEWSAYSTNFDSRQTANIAGAYAQIGVSEGGFNVNAGARVDDHSDFGSEVSFGADASYGFADDWRLRASFGEGFKAPTLFQLFSDFGNETLQPERSRSYDIGIERGDRNSSDVHFAVTAFRRDTRDQIDFVSCFMVMSDICVGRPFGTYDNVGRARAEGFEVELGARISERLRAGSAYSYVKARNRTAGSANEGNDLARRPRHAFSASLDWTGPGDLRLGADVRMVGDSFDDAGNFTRLDGYALADIRASVPVSKRFELFGRVENVTDTQYQTAAGYGTAGRSAYIGVRAQF